MTRGGAGDRENEETKGKDGMGGGESIKQKSRWNPCWGDLT